MTKQLTDDEDFGGLKTVEKTPLSYTYFDAAHYQRELSLIWQGQWIYLCRADAIAEPRDFRTFTIGDQNLIVLRDGGGQVRAFHNTCRHRGSVLCEAEAGRFASKLIVCPYHQWSFDLQGNLQRTTSLAEAPDFCKDDYPLYDIAVEIWRGCIFVCLSQTPPPFSDTIEDSEGYVANWPVEDLVTAHTWKKTMACNWKIFWENFNECLHCPNIHPELCDLVPIYGRRISTRLENAQWKDHAGSRDPAEVGGLRDGAETWSADGKASSAPFAALSAEERVQGQTYVVSMPSTFMAAHVDYMRIVRLLPLGPEETEIQAEWLFPAGTLADPSFDLTNIVDFAVLVMEQDAVVSELNQKGMHCARHETGVLMPEERYVWEFHEWYRKAMGEEPEFT